MNIGIYGYGNLGKGVEDSIKRNKDMSLVAVFTRRKPETLKIATEGVPVVSADDILNWKDRIDVLIICGSVCIAFLDFMPLDAVGCHLLVISILVGTVNMLPLLFVSNERPEGKSKRADSEYVDHAPGPNCNANQHEGDPSVTVKNRQGNDGELTRIVLAHTVTSLWVWTVPFHDIPGSTNFPGDLKPHPSVQRHSPGILPEHIQKQGRGVLLAMPDHFCTDALATELRQNEKTVQFSFRQAEESGKLSVIQHPAEIPQVIFQILFHPA